MEKELVIHSLDQIKDVARQFIEAIGQRRIISFNGKMGAGKTTFIKAVCEVLNVQDNVCSPTFAIVNVYNGFRKKANVDEELEIYHFDFYRLTDSSQALDIGIEEYFYSGNYCFLEWAENIEEFIPKDCIFVDIIEQSDKSRKVIIHL